MKPTPAAVPIVPGQWVVGPQREALARRLVRRYQAGESIRSLAASTGRSYGSVHRLLVESGVELRPRGGRLGRRTPNE